MRIAITAARFLSACAVGAVWADAPSKAPGKASNKEEVQHRMPSLASVFPPGAQPGATVRTVIFGEHLDRASQAIPEDNALSTRLLSVSPTRLEVEIQVSSGAAQGPHYFRIVSPRGASNVALFRVGDQPHRDEREPNTSLAEAQPVAVPVTLNGRLDTDGDSDFFRFRAAAGETLLFDLRAARIGNGLDAALILLDSRGRKLEHEEDTFIWDPFFSHTFREAGEYIAIVQPTHARNDPNFTYQLDIRRAAYLETVSPIALRPGAETEVTLFGRGMLDANAKLRLPPGFAGAIAASRGDTSIARIRVPAEAAPGPYELRYESAGLSNPATFLVDPTPAHAGGVAVSIPTSIAAVARYRNPERFSFRAAAGQTLVFEVRAQRFGSPTDSMLRILDSAGKAIATNDDATFPGVNFNKDSRISHKFQQAGDYTVEMRNTWAVTGENFPYQLRIGEPSPAFDLMLATDQPKLYPGQTAKIKVSATRVDGHTAEIPVVISGLPAGFAAKPVSIAASAADAEIEIAGSAPVGTHARIAVESGSRRAWRQARISSGGGEGATFATLDSAVLVVAEKPLFSLECAQTSVNLVRGAGVDLKVMIRRDDAFAEPLRFQAENLPQGVTLETVESGAESATVRFRAAPGAALGRAARVSILGTGGGQTNAAPRISLLVD